MVDILIVVPHPDDETLFAGGTIRQAVKRGRDVTVVTLTRGGAGRTLGMCSQDELPVLREREFMAAMSVLGVAQAVLFSYPDGDLARHAHDAARELQSLVEDTRPATVITFPANGMNGHPDHTACHHVTRATLTLSNWVPRTLMTFADTEDYRDDARPGYLAPAEVNRLRVPPNCTHDVTDVAVDKLRALGQYDSQARSIVKFLRLRPADVHTEAFHASVWPEPE